MTLQSRSPSQKAEDRRILMKLADDHELTEVEQERFSELIYLTATQFRTEIKNGNYYIFQYTTT